MEDYEVEITAQTFQELRDIFLIVDPSDPNELPPADKHRLCELKKRFEYMRMCCTRLRGFHLLRHGTNTKCTFADIVPRLTKLVKDCLLSHQWQMVLKLLVSLSKEPHNTQHTLWKLGFLCLMQCNRYDLLEKFAKQLPSLEKVSVHEILLDELLCLMSIGKIDTTRELQQEMLNPKQSTLSKPECKRTKEVQTLLKAYQGLLLFLEWKISTENYEQQSAPKEESFLDMLSLSQTEDTSKNIVMCALDLLASVNDIPGVWDIFISRKVELHDMYGEQDQVLDTLKKNRDQNPYNPNAHLYLYKFAKGMGDTELSQQCLQDLIKLDPCNPLVTTLFSDLENQNPGAISLLFDYLDFFHCKDDMKVWAILADRLKKLKHVKSTNEVLQAVQKCWETRRDWWPMTILQCSEKEEDSTDVTVGTHKRAVLKFFASSDKVKVNRKRNRSETEGSVKSHSTKKKKLR